MTCVLRDTGVFMSLSVRYTDINEASIYGKMGTTVA